MLIEGLIMIMCTDTDASETGRTIQIYIQGCIGYPQGESDARLVGCGRRIKLFGLFIENVGTRDGWIIGWGNIAVISEGFEFDVGLGNVRECAPVSAKAKAKAEAE